MEFRCTVNGEYCNVRFVLPLYALNVVFSDCRVGSLLYLNGCVEGKTCFYKRNAYPFGAIGPVSFHWATVPLDERGKACTRTLWLWCHPAAHQILLDELVALFELQKSVAETNKQATTQNPIYNKYPAISRPLYTSATVRLTVLKDTLCRFRLRGPRSHAILSDLLKPADVTGKYRPMLVARLTAGTVWPSTACSTS